MLAFAFHANLGDLELAPCARDVVLRLPRLHVHGGRHEALAARDVGSRWVAIGRLQVVAVVAAGVVSKFVVVLDRVVQDWRGAAVQGSGGLIVQVLQDVRHVYGGIEIMLQDSPYMAGELWNIENLNIAHD